MTLYAILIAGVHSAFTATLMWGSPVHIGGLSITAANWALSATLLYMPVTLVWAVLLGYGPALVRRLLAGDRQTP